jgi:AP-2 complex subunit alpha
LGRFISSKETNVRYLGLETMAHLAACVDSLEPIKRHQETILMSLRDKDISVRRRGLDLLYSMCDTSNAKIVVSELLRYLQVADYAMREEMVLKIAILAEKFASTYSWYVDIILQLISTAGEQVGEEVWFRVVQIVTNNEELQEYAAKTVLNYLGSPQYNETMVKVGGYILGEFGHLIANINGCSPIEQFNAVHAKFNLCSLQTRALLLTTYAKFVNLFPEIKGHILPVLNQYRYVLDAELQQRACEYFSISTMPTDDMLQTVCEEMPPFPERESTLLLKLNQKQGDTEDKRVWVIGGREANMEHQDSLKRMVSVRSNSVDNLQTNNTSSPVAVSNMPTRSSTMPVTAMSHLSEEPDLLNFNDLSLDSSTTATQLQISNINTNTPLAPGYELGYNLLLYNPEGVLYEDSQMQVSIKSEYHGSQGRVALYLTNKTQYIMSDINVMIIPVNGVETNLTPLEGNNLLSGGSQLQRLVTVECTDVFIASPEVFVSYTVGPETQVLHLKLPLVLTKFQEPITTMDGTNFFKRWNQIGGPPRENQVIFKSEVPIQLATATSILQGFGIGLLIGVDPNPNNFVGAGIVDSGKQGGKIGILLRLEPNLEQNVSSMLFEMREMNKVINVSICRCTV